MRSPPLGIPLEHPIDQCLIVDSEGRYLDYNCSDKLCIVSYPLQLLIPQGQFAGVSAWSKTGYNGDVGTTEEDIFLTGACNFPAAVTQMYIYSTNANDTAAGTGIRAAYVTFLTAAGLESTETINMNGLSGVTLANTPYRINHFRASLAGAGGKAAGDIYLMNTAGTRNIGGAGTSVYSQIAAGHTRARNIGYTVPNNYDLYVTNIAFSCGDKTTGKAVRFTTRAKYDNIAGTVLNFFMPYHEVMLQDASYNKELTIPTKLPENTDIKVSAISDTAGAVCASALRGFLVNNS